MNQWFNLLERLIPAMGEDTEEVEQPTAEDEQEQKASDKIGKELDEIRRRKIGNNKSRFFTNKEDYVLLPALDTESFLQFYYLVCLVVSLALPPL